jgi:hypothetical protein
MNLISVVHNEIVRVREVMRRYEEIGAPGRFALAMMRASVAAAEAALESGDVIQLIRAREDLAGYNT